MASVLAVCVSGPSLGQDPADVIHRRQAGLKELGTAFKNLNDELKKPAPLKIMVRASVSDVADAAPQMAAWFPPGSGPQPGVKTAAKPEIWKNRAGFDTAMAQFRKDSAELSRIAAAGDMDAVRAQAKTVAGTCKACHE
ncbi:MAG: cytochrome, partial [Phenylobacterium sp.]|nr:cytochrome [Phenylobacterium sp.]